MNPQLVVLPKPNIEQDQEQEGQITHTWQIPSLSNTEIDHLCIGYIRSTTKQYLPPDLCSICIRYYNLQHSIFDAMKHDSSSQCLITTDMISLNAIQFYMLFQTKKDIEWRWDVLFAYLPKHLSRIECIATISQPETGLISNHAVTFKDSDEYKKISLYKLCSDSSDELQYLKSAQSISIKLQLTDFRMYDKKEEEVIDKLQCIPLRMRSSGYFEWRINERSSLRQLRNCAKGYEIGSDLFMVQGFKWFMELSYFTASIADWCLHLLSLPPTIQRICIRIQLLLVEQDIMFDKSCVFTKENTRMWIFDFITKQQILKSNAITMKLEIFVLHIDYENDLHAYEPYESNANNLISLDGSYEWIINDTETINQWKRASNGTHFRSDIFELSAFKFYLKFYPNGHQDVDVGWTHLFLRLASFPSNICSVCVYAQLAMKDTSAIFHIVAKYSKDSPSWGWKKNKLKTQDIDQLNEFNFKVIIRIIDVFDNNGKIISEQFINNNDVDNMHMIEMPICKNYGKESVYCWRISDMDTIEKIRNSEKGLNFISPMFTMFGLKWYLELIPRPDVDDGDKKEEKKADENIFEATFYICLASSSPNIKDVTISYFVELMELNVVSSNCGHLYDNYSSLVTGCIISINMTNIKQLTFKFAINFIDIYDKKGNNLTQPLINNNYQKLAEEIELKISDKYTWHISDKSLLNQMKAAKPGEFFLSQHFMMHSLKWIMKIYPNGSKISRQGKFNWYIYMVSLPYQISKIAMTYRVCERMSGSSDMDKTDITYRDCQYGWGQHKLKFNDFLNLDKIIFDLEMTIIDMYDNEGNIINPNNYNKIEYPLHSIGRGVVESKQMEYIWEINDENIINNIKKAKMGESFNSAFFAMHGFDEWFLAFFPCGRNKEEENEAKLYIYLNSLPINVVSVSFYFELVIVETKTKFHNCAHFRDNYLSKSWIITYVKTKDIKDLTQFTFSVKLQVVDVFKQ